MTTTAQDTLLAVDGLTMHFDVSPPWLTRVLQGGGRAIVRAVDGVRFEIGRGRTFSLVGESGCGKSTVARLVVGLYKPTRGTVRFDGIDLSSTGRRRDMAPIRKRMQMIFQDPFASLNPRWRVVDIVAEPLRVHKLLPDERAVIRRVGELLEQVRLSARDGEKYPHEFSGGQRQRISIARALASSPEFLVCDEPTSALDVSVQAQIINLLLRLRRELGLAMVFIAHDLAVVRHIADRVAVMYAGRIVETAPTDELFAAPRHPYTETLLAAIPVPDPAVARAELIPGEPPSPEAGWRACAFAPRCPLATERCRAEAPPLIHGDTRATACFERPPEPEGETMQTAVHRDGGEA